MMLNNFLMSKLFSIEKNIKKQKRFGSNNVVYSLFLIFFFCLFVLFSNIVSFILSDNKVDFFMKDATQIATYFLPIDAEISQKILVLDNVVKAYLSGENVLQTKKEEIFDLWWFIKEKRDYLLNVGFSNYESIIDLFVDSYDYKDEIFFLLGENQPFNYLILLENSNEKRPNWWFFWSFAFVQLDGGHVKELQVIDSYFPDYIAPKSRITLPWWYQDLYGQTEFWFIAWNKFGFTDMDGKNIKTLFENIFNRDFDQKRVNELFSPETWDLLHSQFIKGVVFLDSALISDFIPWALEKMWEWQFTNASVDLIRWENKTNKKEMYLKEVVDYYNTNSLKIVKNLISNRDAIVKKRYVNIYLSNITEDLHQFIQKKWFNTVFSKDHIYFWNTNISNNKADGFFVKNIQLFDENGQFLLDTQDDIMDISNLSSWKYRLQIDYDFNIPEKYFQFIHKLEEKYHITLWEREKQILVLSWFFWDDDIFLWKTRETLYFPSSLKIDTITGDYSNMSKWFTDFGKTLIYETKLEKNNTTKQVQIFFTLS